MTIKKTLKLSLLILSTTIATASVASSVTIPNTFSAGSAAVASEVNANFSALDTSVDDNDSRINTLVTDVSSNNSGINSNTGGINSNSTGINSNTSRINSNDSDIGNLQIRVTTLESTTSSVISLGHTAFKNAGSAPDFSSVGDCLLRGTTGNYLFYATVATATNDQCFASAGVQLPDGATISRLDCIFYDNSATNSMNVHLARTSLLTGLSESILRTAETFNNASIQNRGDTTFNTVGGNLINNSNYAYNLFLNFSTSNFSSLGSNARLYGCRITVN